MMTSSKMAWMAAAFALITAACGSPASTPAPPPPSAPAAAPGMSEVTGSAPAGAVVSLVATTGAEPPAEPAVMDQYSKRFEPGLLYVQVGQPVEFRNSEDMPHNVTVTRRGPGTTIFNVGTEPQQKYTHSFDRAGQYDVSCDVHPGMEAVLVVAHGSRATVADESGKFAFSHVPVGDYTMRVTFEGRTIEQALTVTAPQTMARVTP